MKKKACFILANAAFCLLLNISLTQAATGHLEYLGLDSGENNSIWLSTTSSGSFQLESAAQSSVVDQWAEANDGTHISYSPFVSSGSGGTHKLYDVTDSGHKLLDTTNQKENIDLPDLIVEPPIVRPKPPIEILPPEGITPITPERPVKPSLPIGTLPPEGITPEIPVKPSIPIGTLPPEGITPEIPVKPSIPIGTLPPEGITPVIPVKPSIPIGTLPPEGITPEIPVKPSLPIGTLPPEGITPEIPVKPSLPIGTLPPEGITPEIPVKPEKPIEKVPVDPTPPVNTKETEGSSRIDASQSSGQRNVKVLERARLACPKKIDEQTYQTMLTDPGYAHCFADNELDQGTSTKHESRAPVTHGRLYEPSAQWNVWINPKVMKVIDERYGRDTDIVNLEVDLGADRHFGEGWITGLWMSLVDNETSGFHSLVKSNTDGFKIGPYIGKPISDNWALSAFFSYGHFDSTSSLSIFDGEYSSEEYSALVTANGFYNLSDDKRTRVQPKITLNYAYIKREKFDLQGEIASIPLILQVEGSDANYGVATVSAEISHTFSLGKTSAKPLSSIEPFLELGGTYTFQRPNDGKILTSELTYKSTSAWLGLAEVGIRSQIVDSIYIEALLGYHSLGESNYDEWQGSLYFSYFF